MSFFFSATASAQVFDSGPSDSALFTTVIDFPEDESPSGIFLGRIGGIVGETFQLNVAEEGYVISFFDAMRGSEVNISGGTVGCG